MPWLINVIAIRAQLGSTKKVTAKNSRLLDRELSKYIESKDPGKGKKENTPSLWPLVKQVDVKCSSDVLQTGVMLVDLPGVQDANTARNSIAKGYMERCNCIWIAAPITRAIDDKVAKGEQQVIWHSLALTSRIPQRRPLGKCFQIAAHE